MDNTQININIDPHLKDEVEKLSSKIGLTLSDVVCIMLDKFVSEKGFSFPINEIRNPYNPEYNKKTLRAMKKAKLKENIQEISFEDFKKL